MMNMFASRARAEAETPHEHRVIERGRDVHGQQLHFSKADAGYQWMLKVIDH